MMADSQNTSENASTTASLAQDPSSLAPPATTRTISNEAVLMNGGDQTADAVSSKPVFQGNVLLSLPLEMHLRVYNLLDYNDPLDVDRAGRGLHHDLATLAVAVPRLKHEIEPFLNAYLKLDYSLLRVYNPATFVNALNAKYDRTMVKYLAIHVRCPCKYNNEYDLLSLLDAVSDLAVPRQPIDLPTCLADYWARWAGMIMGISSIAPGLKMILFDAAGCNCTTCAMLKPNSDILNALLSVSRLTNVVVKGAYPLKPWMEMLSQLEGWKLIGEEPEPNSWGNALDEMEWARKTLHRTD